jgi:hypothetical protein
MSREFDSPWKETVEVFTAECLELFSGLHFLAEPVSPRVNFKYFS